MAVTELLTFLPYSTFSSSNDSDNFVLPIRPNTWSHPWLFFFAHASYSFHWEILHCLTLQCFGNFWPHLISLSSSKPLSFLRIVGACAPCPLVYFQHSSQSDLCKSLIVSQLCSSLQWLLPSHGAKDEVMVMTCKDLRYLSPVTSWTHPPLSPPEPCLSAAVTSLWCQITCCCFLAALALVLPSLWFFSFQYLVGCLPSFVLRCHRFSETLPDRSNPNPDLYFLLPLSLSSALFLYIYPRLLYEGKMWN